MITTKDELAALCQRIQKCGRVALDTEFFWERTFFPQLGVVQIGLGPDDLHLVDALELPGLPGLGDILADPAIELILHDAIQDLQILSRHCGQLPRHIFDTRRAAGFAGLPSTLSLANLLSEQVGVDLPKSETRSNWLQRPLTEKQHEYALDDIRHLIECADTLHASAEALGNGEALDQEMQAYDDPTLYADTSPESIYARFKTSRLSNRQRALLYVLVDWREKEARKRDRPRGHIIKNGDLVTLAKFSPSNDDDLNRIKELSRNTLQRHRKAILNAIASANQIQPEALPSLNVQDIRVNAETKNMIRDRLNRIAELAKQSGIDPALIGSKADITALVLFETRQTEIPPPQQLTTGWRKKLLEDLPSAPT